jgi:cellulose synthase/poly-beta-1,6-N-acetylglucosamine synthase-like glycosyltransferase
MTPRHLAQHQLITITGFFAVFIFGLYWWAPGNVPHNFEGIGHAVDYLLFGLTSYVVWLPVIMKMLMWQVSRHIPETQMRSSPKPPPGRRVAFVTTYVPSSEPIELLKRTLPAILATHYPHDTWLLDEGNDPAARKLCAHLGVRHFSRANIDEYNQPDGPFARKTKGGNHNAWYDQFGKNYDFVAQIDTDFVPSRYFLERTLGYFEDPQVGFVGTPQIYGNTAHSLVARGAAEQTYNFYGPLMRGLHGFGNTLLIGANHVIRVEALRSVGYYSAHITEDLLTGIKLHAHGWQSRYVPEVLAIGEGPSTWKAFFDQQKRWAYGCMHILFHYTPKYLGQLSWRQRFYYLWIQQHYFSGLAMLISLVGLTCYFGFGLQTANLTLIPFLCAYLGLMVVLEAIDLWLQNFNIRPFLERGILWSAIVINIAVWPTFLMAFFQLFKRRKLGYKVTPKGQKTQKDPSIWQLFTPHFLIGGATLGLLVSSVFTERTSHIMVFWATLTAFSLLLVPFAPQLAGWLKRFSPR